MITLLPPGAKSDEAQLLDINLKVLNSDTDAFSWAASVSVLSGVNIPLSLEPACPHFHPCAVRAEALSKDRR